MLQPLSGSGLQKSFAAWSFGIASKWITSKFRYRGIGRRVQDDYRMYLPEEFLRRAADCQQMAKSTRSGEAKATWNQMAARWLKCAQWAQRPRAYHTRNATRRTAARTDEAA
jgi:hypothetical protein